MKKNLVLLLVLATALSSACSKPSATITALNPGDVVPKNDTWPAYKDQIVSGKVFGNDWQAVSAAVRPVLNNSDELFLDIYGENVEDACTPQMNLEQPMMTVIIPANYGLTEYVSDMLNLGNTQTGNPATFISYGSVSKNVVSEKMKLQVVSISDTGFDLNLFASAKETNGTMTEINGKISVIDCRKKIS